MVTLNEAVQYLAVIFGSVNVINSGMVYGWPSTSLPQLLFNSEEKSNNLHLSSSEGCWITIAPFLASILTTPLSCFIVDFAGPKKTILLTFYPYVLSWITIAVSKNFELLLIGRLLSGISDACTFVAFPIYIEDICEKKGMRLFSIFPICFAFGVLFYNLLGSALSIHSAAICAALVPFVSFFGMLVMPESPFHLVKKNETHQAKEIIRYIRGSAKIEEEYNNLKNQISVSEKFHLTLGDLWRNSSKRIYFLIVVILITAQQLSGITSVIFYTTIILKEANVQFNFDSTFTVVLFALFLATAFSSSFILDSNGKQFFLLWSLFGTAIALLAEGLYFEFIDFQSDVSIYSFILINAMMMYVIFYGLGLQNIPFVMINQIFPRNIKSKILGLAYAYSSFLVILASVLFTIFNDSGRVYIVFYFYGTCCVISIFLILFFVPKTRDVESEETKNLLESSDSDLRQSYEFLLSSFEISDYSD